MRLGTLDYIFLFIAYAIVSLFVVYTAFGFREYSGFIPLLMCNGGAIIYWCIIYFDLDNDDVEEEKRTLINPYPICIRVYLWWGLIRAY